MAFLQRMKIVAVLAVVASLGVSACSSDGSATSSEPGKPRVAIVLGGRANDGGFSQAGADAVTALQKEGLLNGQIRDSVTSSADADRVLGQYAAEGYDLVIGWGIGFADQVFRAGTQFPDTHFVATGGLDILGKATKNVETWTYDAQQLGYLTGYLAGLAQLSPVGVVDGEQQPFILAQWDGFAQGLKAANPTAALLPPIYTGSFEDASKAGQATTGQVSAGAKLIATNAEGYSTGVAAAAKSANVATIGMSAVTSEAAKAVNIGRVHTDMTPILREWISRLTKKTFGAKGTTSTIANHSLVATDIAHGPAPALPPDVETRLADLAQQLQAGTVTITPWKPGK
ncbi:BMP family ABC transporter substrate-binding protein [Amycolatopsis tolypomycina]|uniref:BMP family ABC transporter substrate-binding protein n=1 Tax=Amycolatopsis tolypomycina TaxID=208445 RepID=UPI0033BBFB0C